MTDAQVEKAPEPETLPTEIWGTYIKGRNADCNFLLHQKREWALHILQGSKHNKNPSDWYERGSRIYALRPGHGWEDVSTDFLPNTEDDDG